MLNTTSMNGHYIFGVLYKEKKNAIFFTLPPNHTIIEFKTARNGYKVNVIIDNPLSCKIT